MAGESKPSALRVSRRVVPSRLAARTPSLRTALIVFVAVLILFRWLHLILALDITSTGRQIQLRTEELHRLRRAIADLEHRIAVAESPSSLSSLARELGYGPRPAVYLLMDQPLVPLAPGDSTEGAGSTVDQAQPRDEAGLLSNWGAALGTWEEIRSEP